MALSDRHVLFLVTLLTFIVHNGLALHLESSPEHFDSMIDKQLNITCVTGPVYGAKELVMLEVGKKGSKPIAVLRHQNLDMDKGNIQAEGHIDASDSYLTVTIHNPDMTDAGTYSCLMFYLDEEYQIQEEKALINVTDNQDMTALFSYLLKKVQVLEKSLEEQKEANARQEKVLQDQEDVNARHEKMLQDQEDVNSRLEKVLQEEREINSKQQKVLQPKNSTVQDQANTESVSRFQESIVELYKTVQTQGLLIGDRILSLEDNMKQREKNDTYMTAFSYGYNVKDTIQVGDPIVFSEEILKVGDGYDPVTGIFTCPRDGLYVFHLLITTDYVGDAIQIKLVVNDVTQTTLYIYDKGDDEQACTSSIVSAKDGDTVKPVVTYIDSRRKTVNPNLHYSVYSGYLLRLT